MDPAEYKPSRIQQEFHLSNAREVLFAGAAGPGKSLALLWDPIITQATEERERWARGEIRQSVGHSIYFRRTVPRLLETIKRAHMVFPVIFPGCKWDGDNKMYIDPCGYRFQFAQIQHEDDADNYRSQEYSAIYFDEATEFTKYQYDIITARLRSSDAVLRTKLRIRLATNPGRSPGTDPMWIKNRFVDPAPKGRKLLRETVKLRDGSTETLTRLFIPATLHDNPDPEFRRSYEATLLSKPAHIREAWLNGRWDFVDGAFFSEAFVHDVHVIKPFEIPRTWTRYRSMDWGHKTHGVVLWWALDGDGNLTCYREFTFKGMDAESVALAIREIEIQQGDWNEFSNKSRLSGPADWQIHEERGNQGPTIAESMGQFGVTWERCSKGRKSAAMELIRRLTMPIRGKDDRPNICWFDTCTKCIETIPSVGCNENDPEEPIKDGSTHWLDATFYGIMWRAALPVTKAVDRFEHVDELERKRRSKVANRGRFGY